MCQAGYCSIFISLFLNLFSVTHQFSNSVLFVLIQNKVVDVKGLFPKELTSQDRQQGSYFMSQYPAPSDRVTSVDDVSQCPSQLQDLRNVHTTDSLVMERDEDIYSSSNKRARLLRNDSIKHSSCDATIDNFVNRTNHEENNVSENNIAAVIEDLLEQTNKVNL